MPKTFQCNACALGFELGWFHGVCIDGASSFTFLACTKCGSAYILAHKQDGHDDLSAWGGPVTTEPTEHEGIFRNVPGTPGKTKLATAHVFRPVRKTHRSARLEGMGDERNLATYPCHFCDGVGTLTNNWPKDDPTCPRCKKPTLAMVCTYIT